MRGERGIPVHLQQVQVGANGNWAPTEKKRKIKNACWHGGRITQQRCDSIALNNTWKRFYVKRNRSDDSSYVWLLCHAFASADHAPGDSQTRRGCPLPCVAMALVSSATPLLSNKAREIDSPHELTVGELIIRPHGKWTSRNYIGYGLAGLYHVRRYVPPAATISRA